MSLRTIAFSLIALAVVVVLILAAAIAFGGPRPLPTMASINNPFKSVDVSGLPPLSHFKAEDGTSLAYRFYLSSKQGSRGSVVLVHGSSARSDSMHTLAMAFANAGLSAFALDIRGHGDSGRKGQIDYVGQLEDDLDAFVRVVQPPKPSTLVGFSAGGGFVLRFAGSKRQTEFESYLLLSPFLSQDAPNYRPGSGGWVDVGIPRVIAISMLNSVGVRAFNRLPVTSFALSPEAKAFLTPEYSFALATNFRPHTDYLADIRSANQPCTVLAGTKDEAFLTEKLEAIFRAQGKDWPVHLLPGIGHIPLTLEPAAVEAAVQAVRVMQRSGD